MPEKQDRPLTLEVQSFGARLKYARDAAGLSQKKLSKRSGVDQGLISRLERPGQEGGREGLSADTAVRLARGLGVSVGWLLGAEGDPLGPIRGKIDVETE